MSAAKILWVDDEIDLLKPHILFLQGKGYDVVTSNNGYDAIDLASSQPFDLIILDEMMPGLTGLETLPANQGAAADDAGDQWPRKSEEENIMDKAVGSKIADYLIKPVDPNQVLLSIKKNVHSQQLVTEQTTADYRSEFGLIASSFASARTFADWVRIYKKLVGWEVELTESTDPGVREILSYQKNEANNEFAKFVRANYLSWFSDRDADAPVLSHQLVRSKVFPIVDASAKTTLFLIDNFRLDQWRMIRPVLHGLFDVEQEDFYCSILPTATQYARNAIFRRTDAAGDRQDHARSVAQRQRARGRESARGRFPAPANADRQGKSYKLFSDKIVKTDSGKRLIENFDRVAAADFSVIVYNFLDILSHARTETQIIRDLAEDEAAFRSLTRSWFEHSDLLELMRLVADRGHTVIVTSDHGTIQVDRPVRVQGDRETSSNLRYKTGRNLGFNPKEVFAITKPEQARLPKSNITSTYIFAYNRDFFVYPNDTNRFVRYYNDTFQHGGISMEEMIIPFIVMKPR